MTHPIYLYCENDEYTHAQVLGLIITLIQVDEEMRCRGFQGKDSTAKLGYITLT
jgi:hypothetical protein